MAISGQVILKVTPEILQTQAQTTTNNITKMKAEFDKIETIITRTGNYWIGEAGDAHRKVYTDEKADIQEMLARLSEHPTDLEQIANTYLQVESEVKELAQELPGDIIS